MYVGVTEELDRIEDQSIKTGEHEPHGEDDRAAPDLDGATRIGQGHRRERPPRPDGERRVRQRHLPQPLEARGTPVSLDALSG